MITQHMGGLPELAMLLGPVVLIVVFIVIARRAEAEPEPEPDDEPEDAQDERSAG